MAFAMTERLMEFRLPDNITRRTANPTDIHDHSPDSWHCFLRAGWSHRNVKGQ